MHIVMASGSKSALL